MQRVEPVGLRVRRRVPQRTRSAAVVRSARAGRRVRRGTERHTRLQRLLGAAGAHQLDERRPAAHFRRPAGHSAQREPRHRRMRYDHIMSFSALGDYTVQYCTRTCMYVVCYTSRT